VIINVGRLTKQKGQRHLLESFAALSREREARLVIIGEGVKDEGEGEALPRMARKLGIADRVRFLGFRDNPYKYMARSDVFVLSSLYEGFPNVLVEAMACRCPVVAYNCPSGPSEILSAGRKKGEAEYGILVNGHADIKGGIERILDSRELADRYREAGLRRAAQFSVEKIAGEYIDATLKKDRHCEEGRRPDEAIRERATS